MALRGMNKVLQNLNIEVEKLKAKGYVGLFNAASLIYKSADTHYPKIPVDLGNLKGSWTRSKLPDNGKGIGIKIGFTANYAFRVHEGMDLNFQRPGAGPKFLEKAMEREKGGILKELQEAMKIDDA